ncbi:unnamed protein product [Vitrella brassicaformis CCMP3155]|uniref:Uncharacterized protein n=1 Tax=Vitrella brassicaformis (strain CCMP3155) TaxID=1169540 RepID=A0A0G4EFZ0_VITBC|nr:unnamed protein product [Vitrella brassicaformis CCMP3155]|eukprot:CEL94350.1 unnamed protein product [Vitrella brassicaformis CCMP3155]
MLPGMQHSQQQQEQQPFTYIFVGRRNFYLLSVGDVLRLRAVCTWLSDLFGAPQLRQRLGHSLGTQAGLRRTANGRPTIQLLTFDDEQLGVAELLAAVCVIELGGWGEICEVIELAGQCGCCQLPVTLTADDLHQYPHKTAYLAEPRMLSHLCMVGRHINFGNSVTFQLFQDGERLRAIRDQDGFEFDGFVGDVYQRHGQDHNPPVSSRITYSEDTGWVRLGGRYSIVNSSVSSFAKGIVICHFRDSHQTSLTTKVIDRFAGNDRLHTLLRQSPHAPVEGCTTTASRCAGTVSCRRLVLTDSSHPFVAWITIKDVYNTFTVSVDVYTTEPDVSDGVGVAFKRRFPVTTRLARVVLGPVVSAMVFDR